MESDPNKSLSHAQEKLLLNTAAMLARTRYPNPDRRGCPEDTILKDLAHRRKRLEYSAALVEHIATCSPCLAEYSRQRTAHKNRVRVGWVLAAAAVLAVLVAVPRFQERTPGATSTRKEVAVKHDTVRPELAVALDLRRTGVTRGTGEARRSTPELQRVPRRRLSLAVYMPIGSEEGTYEVNIANRAGESVARTTGTATFEKPAVVLHLSLDLSAVNRGEYQLRLRQPQRSWRAYTVFIE